MTKRRKPGFPARLGMATTLTLLLATVSFNFWLRRDLPETTKAFRKDRAFHYRMTREIVENGRLPEIDRLSGWPQGRNIRSLLPTGMYTLAACFHRITSRFTGYSLRDSILLFTSLAGCLIVIPVFSALKIFGRSNSAAIAGAFLAGIIPAHLSRSFCGWFKFEVVGTLFIYAGLTFLIIALQRKDFFRITLFSLAASVFLTAALACWRLTFVFLLGLDTFLIAALLLGKSNRNLNLSSVIVFASVLSSFLSISYLQADKFSRIITLFSGTILLILLDEVLHRKKPLLSRPTTRLVILGAVILLFAAVFLTPEEEVYGGILSHIRLRVGHRMGLKYKLTPLDRVLYSVQELQPYSLKGLASGQALSAAVIFLPLAFILPPLFRRQMKTAGRMPAGTGLILFLTVIFSVITLLARRNRIFLAPLVAILAGNCVHFPLDYLLGGKKAKPKPLLVLSAVLLLGYLLVFILTARATWLGKKTIRRGISPPNLAALIWLKENTPADAVVLGDWEQGYQIQTYAGRVTVVDGFLEGKENRERIPEISAALIAQDENLLYQFCRNHEVNYVLFHTAALPSHIYVAGVRFSDYVLKMNIQKGYFVPSELGEKTLAVKMVLSPEELQHFELCENLGFYRIFKVNEDTT